MSTIKEESVIGCLLGTAVGDAIGLPCEGLPKRRQRRLFGELRGHRLFFGRGMVSDDTEHTCMVAQALVASAGDIARFTQNLGWALRFWLIGLPVGIGIATLKACLKLWLGFPPEKSGVHSAGNAPAMRSAIIGVCYGHDLAKMRELVRAATRVTHMDPKAELGALAVALAAHRSATEANLNPVFYCDHLDGVLGQAGDEFVRLVRRATRSAASGNTTEEFAAELGLGEGVSGYVLNTVPVALHAWFLSPNDYRSAVLEVVRCGGDTDTMAAIAGGIVGARVGKSGIPEQWLEKLWAWPRTVPWMERLGQRLTEVVNCNKPQPPLLVPIYGILLRNVLLAVVALTHGIRRLLPF